MHNSHYLGAAQLQLIMRDGSSLKKVLYTSDMGALHSNNHYVTNTEILNMFNDVVIMESTYGESKPTSKKKRSYDIMYLETSINTVIERKGTVIFPCFSFSRTQELLINLYDIYGVQKDFCTPIFIDSKLSCDISKLYHSLLHDLELKNGKVYVNGLMFILLKKKMNQSNVLKMMHRRLLFLHLVFAQMVEL